eukprot:Phypoly_transcript_14610.p1 GENE.Phypoly_transcript_14610~~Phypoly_transcript_14610.p1  ORF type:complete len:166 (+),score=22.30 Phypoly_transcript_14610:455-952(+)
MTVTDTCTLLRCGSVKFTSATYIPGTAMAGDGSSNTPTASIDSNGNVVVSIKCNKRKGEGSVADRFHQFTNGNSDHLINLSGFAKSPQTLNFCFGVTIKVGSTSTDVYFGQGHYTDMTSSVNNWWIGSTSIRTDSRVSTNNKLITFDNYALIVSQISTDSIKFYL